jgi:hypothetical protein
MIDVTELDQREDRRWVEEVHAQHAAGVLGPGAELHDRHRRGVRGEELRVGQEFVEPLEHVALELLVLDHGLDRRVGTLDVLELRGTARCSNAAAWPFSSNLPERTARASDRSIAARDRSARSSSASTTVTSTPDRAQTSAIPDPIRPPPITPTRMAPEPGGPTAQGAQDTSRRPCGRTGLRV